MDSGIEMVVLGGEDEERAAPPNFEEFNLLGREARIAELVDRRLPDAVIDAERADAIRTGANVGGVHKRFNIEASCVVADNDGAGGDYLKEDAVRAILGEGNGYFSYQRSVTIGDEVSRRIRRVSIYDLRGGARIPSSSLTSCIATGIFYRNRQRTASIVHQLMHIHCILYLNQVRHGDLHMNNMKVICAGDELFLKAFDFGKSLIDVVGDNRTFDLRYLFIRDALIVPETWKRNLFRKWNEASMLKHYPLHKLLLGYRMNTEDSAERQKLEYQRICESLKGIGNTILTALGRTDEAEDIQGIFADISDTMIEMLL